MAFHKTQNFIYGEGILNIQWKDKKIVSVLTTVDSNLNVLCKTTNEIKIKPLAIAN